MTGAVPIYHRWPEWPELTDLKSREESTQDPEFLRVKQEVLAEYGRDAIVHAWSKVCAALDEVTEELCTRGASIIPDISFDTLNSNLPIKSDIRRKGCCIIRNVIPAHESKQHLRDLERYVEKNQGKYTGFPAEQPSMFDLFNTPPQNALRSHPNLLETMAWMNALWDYPEEGEASPDPLVYADGFRIRQPGTEFLGLGPHIDAGGLARWGSPTYRRFYHDIFAGYPEKHNAYDMHTRKDANQAIYGGKHPSTVLRAFQGWTALSRNAPREGTILLYPFVALSTAYVLLRPFFTPPTRMENVLDASKWTFATDSWFPGTSKQLGQSLSPSTHPHLRLKECLIPLPKLEPGDTVWWHSDMIHAVETEHIGNAVASVIYIAATPSTRINRAYCRRQYDAMIKGMPPEDFAYGIDESTLEGFQGFEGQEQMFRDLMGYTT